MDEEAGGVSAAADVNVMKAAPLPPPADNDEEMAAWKAPAAMLLVQLFNTGMVLLSKVAIGGGMFVFALLTYRSLFGAAFILPIALLRERYGACVRDFRVSPAEVGRPLSSSPDDATYSCIERATPTMLHKLN